MFRLTREVRFAVNARPDDALRPRGTNGYAGLPPLTGRGAGHWFALRATVSGPLDPASRYVVNIKRIDAIVRERAVPAVERFARSNESGPVAGLVADLFDRLRDGWAELRLEAVDLSLSPFLRYAVHASELPMVRLSQRFEFSATHRLHNPALPDDENCRTFGKCNNPHGHGHNYELQVTIAGRPDANGLLIDVPAFERIVAATVVDRFDHKNLNVELPEFRLEAGGVVPTVENIAMTIYRLLNPPLADAGAKLASVTVWETPKTWCEYSE